MPRISLIHWNDAEAQPRLDTLRSLGYGASHSPLVNGTAFRAWRSSPPDAFVIDLTRLPSHGREVATALRNSKATRHVPLVFAGGAPEKQATLRALFPDAVYTEWPDVADAILRALAAPPASPAVPVPMMDRYAGRTVAQKLGIRPNSTVALLDPPRNVAQLLAPLPPDATLSDDPDSLAPVTLWFVRDAAAYLADLPERRTLARASRLWVLWPKRTSGVPTDLTQALVRESALALGLVDYKICAVDATWSAMLFTGMKERAANR